jgi:hypothetical protein
MSAGPSKTDARGDSSNVAPATSTDPWPASGRIITSVSPVSNVSGDSNSSTFRLDSVQPADSGVTSTVYGGVALRAGM